MQEIEDDSIDQRVDDILKEVAEYKWAWFYDF